MPMKAAFFKFSSGFVALAALVLTVGWSSEAQARREYGPHSGYLSTTAKEREAEYRDMIVIQPPPPIGPSLQERIFNDQLNKEFKENYEQRFGRTEIERVFHSPNRYTYYNDLFGFRGTEQEVNDERRRFGEYMVRRLTEWHFDNWAKNDPKVRPVWEAKERISQIKVEVREFRFDMQYSIAGNTFDMKVINPYLNTFRLRIQMDPGAFGPGNIDETILTMGRPVTKKVSVQSDYFFRDGIIRVVGTRPITPALSSTLTLSTFTKGVGRVPGLRESLYLAGMSYVF